MYRPGFYDENDPMAMYQRAMLAQRGGGGRPRRFDEYYRCYPIAMMPGPERDTANHGGKVFLPASALDKLTTLHITYPMLFELVNGARGKQTHSGVLEFVAEEGRIYVPFWIMQTLSLEPGDLLQVKSTDLPPGHFIKLQPQSPSFLDISDPKAVLENAFRNFSCLTKGDIFTFSYNDTVYEMAVLEVKPEREGSLGGISVQETDLSVDFAPPVGYVEPSREPAGSGASTPGRVMKGKGGVLHAQGTMAQAINYSAIAPSATSAATGARAASSNFGAGGHMLKAKKGSKDVTPKPSTPVAGASSATTAAGPPATTTSLRRTNGPQPLRLPPGKLFFGYEIKPVRKADDARDAEEADKLHFRGQGNTLRKKKGDGGSGGTGSSTPR
ncbi:hypothetical protein B0A49_00215 [Cryomyces minteri]|uniref:Ubiquitin fusion degradation protein 1 n=1 Tax=Cryomyces minteri TaxID=331657 RepID=A0A4U0XX75_9PEZI|nr:hypothetical protein B0A49_00215 [Cryomyces minteri]